MASDPKDVKDVKDVKNPKDPGTARSKKGEGAPDGEKKGGKKKLLAMLVLVVVFAGAAYFVLGRGGKSEQGQGKEAAATALARTVAESKPGAVVKLDAIQVNLADAHYLKVTLALQATAAAAEDPDGSKALDLAVDEFSNKQMSDMITPDGRKKLERALVKKVVQAYEGEVMDVYFTEFVMQ